MKLPTSPVLRIGTRGSALARVQTENIAARLRELGHTVETRVLSTAGDRATDRAFTDIGAFGVFAAEIETALLAGSVDVAVHSYKDLPSQSAPGLVVAAVPERVDPADVLLVRAEACSWACSPLPLGTGARVGTSALRREALLREVRPDLDFALLRGNVVTRVGALVAGQFDAIVLAAAGLKRLERAAGPLHFVLPEGIVQIPLDPTVFVPAPSQGALAVQVREDDQATRRAVAPLDDSSLASPLLAERAALALVEGGCRLPFGAWCHAHGTGALVMHCVLGGPNRRLTRCRVTGSEPHALAALAYDTLMRRLA
ncbi:MAG: hydroxymethylbilane synthase [Gemmatimonadaceae bacterium]